MLLGTERDGQLSIPSQIIVNNSGYTLVLKPGILTEWSFWVSDQIPIHSSEIDAIGISEGVCLKISHPDTQNPDKSSFLSKQKCRKSYLTE